MSVASDAVGVFRDLWADRFVDDIEVSRFATPGTLNPVTLQYDETTTLIYSGDALIRPLAEADRTLPNELRTFDSLQVLLPFNAPLIQPEDRITVTACPLDTSLVGAVLRVRTVTADTYLTRREVVAELDRGRGSDR